MASQRNARTDGGAATMHLPTRRSTELQGDHHNGVCPGDHKVPLHSSAVGGPQHQPKRGEGNTQGANSRSRSSCAKLTGQHPP